jgi:hypothetical protein
MKNILVTIIVINMVKAFSYAVTLNKEGTYVGRWVGEQTDSGCSLPVLFADSSQTVRLFI